MKKMPKMRMKTSTARSPRWGRCCAVALGAAVALGGCIRSDLIYPDLPPIDPLATPVYAMAQICVVRPHTWAMARTSLFRDNGNLVGATRGPSYFCYVAQPGVHRLEVLDDTPAAAVEFSLTAGQRLFFHHRVGLAHDRLSVMTEQEAPELLDKCDYSQLLDTPQRLVTSEAPARPVRQPAAAPQSQPDPAGPPSVRPESAGPAPAPSGQDGGIDR